MEEIKTFEEYMGENPRNVIPDKEMKTFLEFAKQQYSFFNQVNFSNVEPNDEDQEVEDYIGESMEALILFRKFKEKK